MLILFSFIWLLLNLPWKESPVLTESTKCGCVRILGLPLLPSAFGLMTAVQVSCDWLRAGHVTPWRCRAGRRCWGRRWPGRWWRPRTTPRPASRPPPRCSSPPPPSSCWPRFTTDRCTALSVALHVSFWSSWHCRQYVKCIYILIQAREEAWLRAAVVSGGRQDPWSSIWSPRTGNNSCSEQKMLYIQ